MLHDTGLPDILTSLTMHHPSLMGLITLCVANESSLQHAGEASQGLHA